MAAAVVSMTLPETYNQPTLEDLVTKEQEDGDELESGKNGIDPDNNEKNALM